MVTLDPQRLAATRQTRDDAHLGSLEPKNSRDDFDQFGIGFTVGWRRANSDLESSAPRLYSNYF
jgi:hypothetical protein